MAEKLEHNAVESVTKNVRKGLLRASQRFTQRQRAELVTLLISQVGLVIPRNGKTVTFFVT